MQKKAPSKRSSNPRPTSRNLVWSPSTSMRCASSQASSWPATGSTRPWQCRARCTSTGSGSWRSPSEQAGKGLYCCSLAKNAAHFLGTGSPVQPRAAVLPKTCIWLASTGSSGLLPPSEWPSSCSRTHRSSAVTEIPSSGQQPSASVQRNYQFNGVGLELIGIRWPSIHKHNPFKLCLISVAHLKKAAQRAAPGQVQHGS